MRVWRAQALLNFICELAKTAGQQEHANRMVVSLYAVLLCEVLVAGPQVRPMAWVLFVSFQNSGVVYSIQFVERGHYQCYGV